jgi:hypothetical protein
MHYKGTLTSNGTKFDSSYDRGKPFSFKIGRGDVIQGWDEGVMEMSLGEKAVGPSSSCRRSVWFVVFPPPLCHR